MIETRTQVRARYAETDKMGIVYYARYLEWFEVGRTELLRELGHPYSRMERGGVLLPVIEVHCRYHRPARYDEVIQIVSRVPEMPRARIRIEYELFNPASHLLAEGFTVHSFMDAGGKALRPPKDFLALMRPFFKHQASRA